MDNQFLTSFCLICFIVFNLNAQDPALLEELESMYEVDQTARLEMIRTGISDQVEEIDRTHLPRLKAIVDQVGWPGYRLVGEEGSRKFWLLVQHCDRDLDFQKYCLELLQEAVLNEDASKESFAYLTDRVLVHEGNPQI